MDLKEEFSYLQHDSSLIPFLPKAIDAAEINFLGH